ncbi:hypothetical protein B0H16DRAFT_1529787 [Mycena metata]|uniref:Uncharacterized protein n=1 Tax=Mycena metata TaxID=1033252 RepID=A0AAD7JGL8_9AGAR|nr:hypothetical protein B0H16DRAFT_1571842 [Mycena metata]KAJ7762136.1 hypothetical protein B0H16DRAFT_1529787 [Mycena metata]
MMSWLRSLSSSIILSILASKKAPEIEGTITKLADVPAPEFFQRRSNYGAAAIIDNKDSGLRMIDYAMGDECKTEEGSLNISSRENNTISDHGGHFQAPLPEARDSVEEVPELV